MNTPVENTPVAALTFGESEAKAAIEFGKAMQGEVTAFNKFYVAIIEKHDIAVSDLLKSPTERKAGNGLSQAQYEFVRMAYAVSRFGIETAKEIISENSKSEKMINLSHLINAYGSKMTSKTAAYIYQNQLGKEFKAFLARLAIRQGEGDGEGKKNREVKNDMQYVNDRCGSVINRLKAAEKLDGSIDFEVAAKFQAALVDLMKTYGIK